MKFCGEIAYLQNVPGKESVHSDLCFNCNDGDAELTDVYRKLLHDCLDEWLNKSNGTGAFWIGDSDYFDFGGE